MRQSSWETAFSFVFWSKFSVGCLLMLISHVLSLFPQPSVALIYLKCFKTHLWFVCVCVCLPREFAFFVLFVSYVRPNEDSVQISSAKGCEIHSHVMRDSQSCAGNGEKLCVQSWSRRKFCRKGDCSLCLLTLVWEWRSDFVPALVLSLSSKLKL
jgi:hypothetical protein